jgi:hypothetical protein
VTTTKPLKTTTLCLGDILKKSLIPRLMYCKHFTILIMQMPAGIDVLITPLSADNRHRWTSRVPFHATDNPSARKHRAEDRPAARLIAILAGVTPQFPIDSATITPME